MSPSIVNSEKLGEIAKALMPGVKPLLLFFPEMDWTLKKASYDMNAQQYLAITIFMTLITFLSSAVFIAVIYLLNLKLNPYFAFGTPILIGAFTFLYFLFQPKLKILREARLIDKDLEYMLKDMQIQLTAGVPIFNAIANIATGGYGECSNIANKIVREVESGSSMKDVLYNQGMFSPSENLRRVFWQISNAMQTGSDVKLALMAICDDIREEKESKIKIYGQEMSLWALVYMMLLIVLPSMGVTLILVLSSFIGVEMEKEGVKSIFWTILIMILVLQLIFISLIRSKRPDV
ncbi:MAG: hypothetical protein DRO94_03735 [Candidatus Altiarchaeales archaeon]|nr:MAG: hypothetical protein DRO94_03735 [Candidatus Altiarchaeales archaeon]